MSHIATPALLLCIVFSAASTPATAAAASTVAASSRPLRDPFAKPAPPAPVAAPVATGAAVEPPPLRLRAVILNGTHSLANIDGAIVGAGEHVHDYTVLRIDARGVLLARTGRQQLLTISEKDKQ